MDKIERILRQFLWKGPKLGRGDAKVSWEDVCLPKVEGGLGIRSLRECNKAAMLKYIWILFLDKEALWCRWIHSTFLKRGNFWVAKKPTVSSWAWKKLFQLRIEFQLHFHWRIGDGHSTSLRFDNWHPRGPLNLFFSDFLIYNSGLSRQAKVADLFTDNGQAFKLVIEAWDSPLPSLTNTRDRFCWSEASSGKFSVALAWELIRRKKNRVGWDGFIWNNAILPRYQFNLWLITKRRLPTQSLLMSYGRIEAAFCPFCNEVPDSVNHLFFGCHVTSSVASFWATRCGLPWRNKTWEDNLTWASTLLTGKDFHSCIGRFSFGALCHIVWKNRNDMLFRGVQSSTSGMKKHLMKVVQDKACTFKNVEDSPKNRRLQRSWELDPSIFV